jgi:hypothetical protein
VFDLWDEASRDVEAEAYQRRITSKKIAVAPLWPFLAAATSSEEFDMRLDLAMERIASETGDDLPDVLASLRADFELMREAANNEEGTSDDFHDYGVRGEPKRRSQEESDDEGDRADAAEWRKLHGHGSRSDFRQAAVMPVGSGVDDEAAAESESDPENGLGPGNSVHVAKLILLKEAGSESHIIVDAESGYKVGGPFPSRGDAEQALSSGKFKGRNVSIQKRDEKRERPEKGQKDKAGGSVREKSETPKAKDHKPHLKGGAPKQKAAGFGQHPGRGFGQESNEPEPASGNVACAQCGSFNPEGQECPNCGGQGRGGGQPPF